MNTILNRLIEELHHPDPNVRSKAALGLGKLGDADAVNILLTALGGEPDIYVREDITWALVRIGGAAIEPLIDLLYNTNPSVRHHAAHVLGKIADVQAVDALINALKDSDTAVVSKAAFGLGQIGDVRAIPALVRLVGHPEHEIETMLITVLERFGTASVQPLIEVLADQRWQVRERAADILGQIGDERALPGLITALADEAWQVRFAVVAALGHIGGAKAKQAVDAMQNDSDQQVRTMAVKLMKHMKG